MLVFFYVQGGISLLEHKILGYIYICKGTNKVGFLGILQLFRCELSAIMKKEAAGSSEALVHMNKTTWCHVTEHHNLNCHKILGVVKSRQLLWDKHLVPLENTCNA